MRKTNYLKPDDIMSTHTMTKGLVVLKTTLVEKVLLIGGSTGKMLEALEVIGDDHNVQSGESFEENNGYALPSIDEEASSGSKIKTKLKEFHERTASFTALDRNYLTPFFTIQNDDEDDSDDSLQNTRITEVGHG